MKWNFPKVSVERTVGLLGSASVLYGYGAWVVASVPPLMPASDVPTPRLILPKEGAMDADFPLGGTR